MHRPFQRQFQSVSRSGASLPETMVAVAILLTVIAISFGSYVFLQRGLGEATELANARASQARVLDYLALDLRNALGPIKSAGETTAQTAAKLAAANAAGIHIKSIGQWELAALNAGANQGPLTLEIPVHYSAYDTTGSVWSGDPKRGTDSTLVRGESAIQLASGDIIYPAANRLTVVYNKVTSGNTQTLTRTVTPSGGTSTARQIAVFPAGFQLFLSFRKSDLTLSTVATDTVKIVTPQISFTPYRVARTVSRDTTTTSNQLNAIATNVFLRGRYSR